MHHNEGQVIKTGQPFYELELSENQNVEEDEELVRLWNKLPLAAKYVIIFYVIIFALLCEAFVCIRLMFF